MANQILTKTVASATFTITLASLTSGSGRQSTLISNTNNYPAALVYFIIKSGAAAPTAGQSYDIFLLRGDAASPNVTSDGAGASDAAFTPLNSKLLGSIVVTASATTNFYGIFDTSRYGPLGPLWGVAVRNSSGQTIDATEGNHIKRYDYYYPEVQ